MELSVRPAEPDDWDWIKQCALESAFLTIRPSKRTTMDDKELVERVERDIKKYHYQAERPEAAFIAMDGSKKAGVVWVGITDWENQPVVTSWILDIYVVKEYRGKGVGKLLMAKAEEWSREQGAKQMWLNVGGSNEDALNLYRSVGYEVEALHMSKQL